MNGPFSAHVGVVILATLSVAACQPSPAPEAAPEPAQSLADTQTPGPAFQVDPFWPQALPDEWLVGNVVGLAVDSHDNVWIHPSSEQPAWSREHSSGHRFGPGRPSREELGRIR